MQKDPMHHKSKAWLVHLPETWDCICFVIQRKIKAQNENTDHKHLPLMSKHAFANTHYSEHLITRTQRTAIMGVNPDKKVRGKKNAVFYINILCSAW